MSPIEYIEEGIREGNWGTVCEGYERLTGESLPFPKTAATLSDAENALRQIASIVSSTLDGPIAEICEPTTEPARKKPGRPKGRKKKKQKKVAQDGEDASLILDSDAKTGIQKEAGTVRLITNDPDPEEVARNKAKAAKAGPNKLKLKRKAARTYNAKCSECKETFESERPDGEYGQKCRNCLQGTKRSG